MKKLLFIVLFGVLAVGCENLLPNEQTPTPNHVFVTDSEGAYILEAEGGEVVVTIATNVDYSIVIPEEAQAWLSVADTRAEARMEKQTFIIAENETFEERSANVELVDNTGEVLQTISFIQCAAALPDSSCPSNEIWYTNGSTTKATTPNSTTAFGANIVSNTYDAAKECWIIKFDGKVTTIGDRAFYECVSIKNIVIPISVTSIGDFAFGSCSSLTSVTIPDSVTTLGDAVFRKCSSLTSVNIPNGVTTIRKSTFYGCTSLANIVIPDSVTEIGEFAFAWCSNLTSVTIPNSVTSLGANAFKSCTNVQMFNGKFASDNGRCLIVNGVLNSFAIGCGAMEYTIPAGVTTIGESAFSHCTSLTSVTIPDSVTTIGDNAFYYCESLTSVYCKAITPPAGGSDMFYKNASGRKIYVPMESVEAYKSASGWSSYSDYIEGYNF